MSSINETEQAVNPAMPAPQRVTTLTVGRTKLLLSPAIKPDQLIMLLEILAEARELSYQYTAKGSIYYPVSETEITTGIQYITLAASADEAHRIGGTL